MNSKARMLILAMFAVMLWPLAGCDSNTPYVTPERLQRGLVVILPGIEGESPLNHDIRRGLAAGGVRCAMPIYSWGRPIPIAGPLLNQTDFLGNRLAGAQIARMITQYQDSHPGRPVYLVGHSGGGGVAVFAAEAMPEGRKVNGLVLLSASISSAYDLTKAMNRCQAGIVNFYNKADAALLLVGTIIVGNVDGTHGPSAGLIGFDRPGTNAMQAKRIVYSKLFQISLADRVTGLDDPHAAATRRGFVAAHVARWVLTPNWPPRGTRPLAAGKRPRTSGRGKIACSSPDEASTIDLLANLPLADLAQR